MTLVRAAVCLVFAVLEPAFAQETPGSAKAPSPSEPAKMTLFDLDFPGGTPGQLVSAIQKASQKPLNAVVPPELAATELPPLTMRQIDADHLFKAMFLASRKQLRHDNTTYEFQCGFLTDGKPTDASVWYFTVFRPALSEPFREVHFFLLTPYLDEGLTVDDITTAISTGWKMLGDSERSQLSYHKETNLLIVVADGPHLDTVRSALDALKARKTKPTLATPLAKSPVEASPGQ